MKRVFIQVDETSPGPNASDDDFARHGLTMGAMHEMEMLEERIQVISLQNFTLSIEELSGRT